MEKNKQPGICFKNVILKQISFSREIFVPENASLKVSFNCQRSFSDDKKKLVVVLECVIKEKKEAFQISCAMAGFFEIDKACPNMQLEKFAKENALAVILPFIREEISSTTLKAGINPVLLPPLNIHALLEAQQNA